MEYSRDFNIFMNGIQNDSTPIFLRCLRQKGGETPSLEKFKIVYLILSRDEQGISTPSSQDGL